MVSEWSERRLAALMLVSLVVQFGFGALAAISVYPGALGSNELNSGITLGSATVFVGLGFANWVACGVIGLKPDQEGGRRAE